MKFCSNLIEFLAFLLNELFCNDEIFVAVFSCAAIQLCVFCTSDKNDFFTKTNKWYESTDTTLSKLMQHVGLQYLSDQSLQLSLSFSSVSLEGIRLLSFFLWLSRFNLKLIILWSSVHRPKTLWNSEYN